MKKRTGLISFILVAVLFLVSCGKSTEEKWQEQYDLGVKYISEGNYEEAIIAFTAAIEIDSQQIRAYTGLVTAYMGAQDMENAGITVADATELFVTADTTAEDEDLHDFLEQAVFYYEENDLFEDICDYWLAVTDEFAEDEDRTALLSDITQALLEACMEAVDGYLEEDELEQAVSLLNKLLELDGENTYIYKELEEIYISTGDLDHLLSLAELFQNMSGEELPEFLEKLRVSREVLAEIMEYCEEEDLKAVLGVLQEDEYQELEDLVQELGLPLILTVGDKKLGFYAVESEYYGNVMLYYGEYQGDLRHGEGAWMGYEDGNTHYAYGSWENDMPNGEQHVEEWTTKFDREIIGTAVDGLWDGPVTWVVAGKTYETNETNGKWVILEVLEEGAMYRVSEWVLSGRNRYCMTTDDPDEILALEGFMN